MRRRPGRVAALVGVTALAAMVLVGTAGLTLAQAADAKVDVSKLAKSLHGAVETKAFTAGTVLPPLVPAVGSVLLDPGPAYAYSTLDRDDYGSGNVNFTMTARGANVDPGAIAGAAMWAPANCDDPNAQLPCALRNPTDPVANGKRKSGGANQPGDIGLHNAAGFPAYAEALFPDQPGQPSQQTVYKCVVNKDANGAQPTNGQAQQICQQGGDSVPLSAWARAVGDEVKAEGFSRAEGFASPGMLSVGPSESHSLVTPEADGTLHSTGFSTINSIDIGGGQIHIDQVRSEGDIKANADKVLSATGSCTLSGVTIGGNRVAPVSGQEFDPTSIQPLLAQVEAATKLKVEIAPATGVKKTTVEGAKQVVECAGLHIAITDLRTQSLVPVCSPAAPPPPPKGVPPLPQCVPPLGVRYELSFGKLAVQEAVNAFVKGAENAAATTPVDVAGTTIENTGGSGAPTADITGATPGSLAQAPFPSSTGGNRAVRPGTINRARPAGFKLVGKNLASVAAWTAGSAAAIGLCIWFMLGVVDSVAKGTRLRLPGL